MFQNWTLRYSIEITRILRGRGSQDDLQNVLKVFWNTPYAKEFENTHALSYEDPTNKRHDLTSLISLVIGFAAFFVVLAFLDLRIRGESFAALSEGAEKTAPADVRPALPACVLGAGDREGAM